MKIRIKYLLFFVIALISSLCVFIAIALSTYSTDKIGFVKEKAMQDALDLARQVSEAIKVDGKSTVLSTTISDLFLREDLSDKFLIDKTGKIQAGDAAFIGKSFAAEVSINALSRINMNPLASGLVEAKDNQGRRILIAYAGVPEADQFVLQVYQLSQVNRFLVLFVIKILFSFVAVSSFFFLLGFFVIGQLASGLELLSRSAEAFGAGDFSQRVKVRGRDEVAALGAQFNRMAGRIESNLKLEEEKARLKMEMETAQKVQEMLFLPGSYRKDGVQVSGFYEPASECGGDWWHYFEKDDSVWICIGDVTGHGVGAAMLTSSVRAAFTFFERQEGLTPKLVLSQLNDMVWQSVGGKLNMTFVVLEINRKTKKLRYALASHEPPILIKRNVTMNKNDVVFLVEANGSRLGQDRDSVYNETELEIEPGARVICYSDGIYDVVNNDGKALGESHFLRRILKVNSRLGSADIFVKTLIAEIAGYRGQNPLRDDLSLICAELD